MAQFGRPSTDTVNESWVENNDTSVDIFEMIDEVTADDGDYIKSASAPTSDAYVTKLTNLEDPLSSSGHTVRYRYQKDSAGGAQINLVVELRQGYVSEASQGTLIASATHNDISNGWTAGSITLSAGEADAITDYTSLFLRFVANQV
jgi:hypothetical protein